MLHALLSLIWFGGWVLEIVGFASARAAQRQVAALQRELARQARAAEHTVMTATPVSEAEPRPTAEIPPAVIAQPDIVPPPDEIRPSAQPPPATAPAQVDIEALLTMRWGVWLGALALALAGVFLIRYAVEQELLGPGPRCAGAGLFGMALIAAAEYFRWKDLVRPGIADLVPPALAAAGSRRYCSVPPTAPARSTH